MIRKPLKQLAEALDPDCFWQIHRSTIVNAERIASFERDMRGRYLVRLKDGKETLVASRQYADLFKQM